MLRDRGQPGAPVARIEAAEGVGGGAVDQFRRLADQREEPLAGQNFDSGSLAPILLVHLAPGHKLPVFEEPGAHLDHGRSRDRAGRGRHGHGRLLPPDVPLAKAACKQTQHGQSQNDADHTGPPIAAGGICSRRFDTNNRRGTQGHRLQSALQLGL